MLSGFAGEIRCYLNYGNYYRLSITLFAGEIRQQTVIIAIIRGDKAV